MVQNKKLVIVGGGIAGLAAAFRVQEEISKKGVPIECILLESLARLGGKIQTERFDGFILERGPDSFISQKPAAIQFCKKLSLEDRLTGTNPNQTRTFVYTGKRMRTLPDGLSLLVPTRFIPFATTSLFSVSGKIRMGMDLFIPKKSDPADESLASFVRRRLGEEALQKMAEPMLAGIYASDPEKMSLKSTFPMFFNTEQKYRSLILGMLAKKRLSGVLKPSSNGNPYTLFVTLKTGLAEMVEAVIDQTPDIRFQTGIKVQKIERGSSPSLKWNIILENGQNISADAMILAPPAHVTARLIQSFAPKIAERLHEINYVSTATVTLAYRKEKFPHPLDGFGFLVPQTENRKIMACTWTSTKFPQRAPEGFVLLRCYIGGALKENLAEQDSRTLEKIVREDLKGIMAIDREPVFVRVNSNHKANVQYHVGHAEKIAAIENELKVFPGIFLAGSAYKGIGIPDCISSGVSAAESTLDQLFKSGESSSVTNHI